MARFRLFGLARWKSFTPGPKILDDKNKSAWIDLDKIEAFVQNETHTELLVGTRAFQVLETPEQIIAMIDHDAGKDPYA